MLETVRIRRAGYNVRLTYEEFIQHYRILLPKGLLSSQKDVRDFMNHLMDLNKQHYQLGITKIYMRESQKMKLDIKLHTKIIESIICIQRWFRSIFQRQKFLYLKQATIVIQSNWRMCLAQRQVHFRRACFHGAAITIQSTFRMFILRRKYLRVRHSVICLQAHIRGKLARMKFQQNLKQKHMRERQKLRSTQSLPVNERSVDIESPQVDMIRRVLTPTPRYSLDIDIEIATSSNLDEALSEEKFGNRLTKKKRDQMLDQTEQQIRDLIISKDEQYFDRNLSMPTIIPVDSFLSFQTPTTATEKNRLENDVLDVGSKKYDVEKVMRKNSEDLTPPIDSLKRFDITKMPIRRVDSGPSRREIRFDPKNQISLQRPTPNTNIEIVYTTASNSIPSPSITTSNSLSQSTLKSSVYNQQYSQDTVPYRRDLVRSMNDEYHYNIQPPIVYHQSQQQQHHITDVSSRVTISEPPKGR